MFKKHRSLPVRWLFLLGHLPLGVFAVGIVAATLVVFVRVREEAAATAAALARSPLEAVQIRDLGDGFITLWMVALTAFFVFLVGGSLLVAWTHRLLSARIARITGYAQAVGRGQLPEPLAALHDDPLGTLEEALGQVARELVERNDTIRAESGRHELVAAVQRAMSMAEQEEDAIFVVSRVVPRVAPERTASLLLADSSQAHLRSVYATGGASVSCGVESPARCPAVQQGRTLTFPDSDAIDACVRMGTHPRGACSAVCVPLTIMGRAVGVLHTVGTPGEQPPREQVESIEALGNAFGTRVGVLRALATSQLQAGTDPLTGLPNRRSLEARAKTMMEKSAVVSVALGDLDHFKRLNDTYGHATGDRALRLFSQVVRTALRPMDVVARFGGEEFAILLPDCPLMDAVEVLDRVREAVEQASGRGDCPAFTVSFGVASAPQSGDALADVLAEADRALYEAKSAGRNRVMPVGGLSQAPVVTPGVRLMASAADA